MHTPVLLNELINLMEIKSDGVYVDCTGGGGGHAGAVLSKLSQNGRLFILDRDLDAVKRLNDLFDNDKRVKIIHSNFSDVENVMADNNLKGVDGLYADFGVSSFQLTDGSRGFSFRNDGPLDMRMDTTKGLSAADVVNSFTPENMATIITKFGEEKFARKIVSDIVKRRALKKFTSTADLADVIKAAVPRKFHKKGMHPATQTFQAIRIFVNGELEAILELMNKIAGLINKGGRFVAISFHSLEDRIVKDALNDYAKACVCPPEIPICVCGKVPAFKIITRKPVIPSEKELLDNPLSRSGKLRAAERV